MRTKYYILANRDTEKGVLYVLGESARGVWESVIESEWMGTAVTRDDLKAQGWYARPVWLSFEDFAMVEPKGWFVWSINRDVSDLRDDMDEATLNDRSYCVNLRKIKGGGKAAGYSRTLLGAWRAACDGAAEHEAFHGSGK